MDEHCQHLTKRERRELKRQEKTAVSGQLQSKRFVRRIIFWSFVILAIGGVIWGMIQLASRVPSYPVSSTNEVSPSDWSKGNAQAQVTLIEYSDFQCPACKTYYPILKQLYGEFSDTMLFVYRHFPLQQIHVNAHLAARAAQAAGKQGKFWEMHDTLFENQTSWSSQKNAIDTFVSYAQTLLLDVEEFKKDIDSKETREKVDQDYAGGMKANIQGTPTFFLNGEKIQNPRNYDELRSIVEQAISVHP